MTKQGFIPATMARPIGKGVFFRPIRSWHSLTYAGEGLRNIPDSKDRSGCLNGDTCRQPLTVTHRLYWHERDPTKTVSAFLSYPDAMGCSDGAYFWEAYGIDHEDKDIIRYFGEHAEADMETAIRDHFGQKK